MILRKLLTDFTNLEDLFRSFQFCIVDTKMHIFHQPTHDSDAASAELAEIYPGSLS